ncbi:hypothetical protein SDRG_05500 [Saprolegnia diclina VS20]|uniref:Uncharacterized protein n=1 Tax=Saprolegnia diclina (strain VS20) TaxID=1156394 RepID=T0QRA1_SAPDV|nr:hypothetical protein SDRG_05500 [Saprolegnia diclina VS20]EQC37276.1 hypothetical protein SDRG_05500 [Saprolegnia diclina VS20]|eukprot:XP_008609438.1 hypothetical protein SDRG_05500 [Saprolegnia diclina VS20]
MTTTLTKDPTPPVAPAKSSTTIQEAAVSSAAECPFANVDVALPMHVASDSCPFHAHAVRQSPALWSDVPVVIRSLTFQTTPASAQLLRDVGGGDTIRELCTRFYARAFLDKQLKPFFFEEDGATAHGQRLADWIIQKMGGEGQPWTDSGRWGLRQVSHAKAWVSEKRDPSVRGDHFNLTDARTWMRIHFWAARECGLADHAVFWRWYTRFLQHFIAIYERRAVRFAQDDAAWSAVPDNLARYLENDHRMPDVI